MRRSLALLAVALTVLVAGCGGGSDSSSGGKTNIVLWHGYVDVEGKALTAAAKRFNATHPKIHVTVQNYGNADYALNKVLTAIRGGSYPDIVYLYGSWAANMARTPKAVDLAPLIKADPSINWNDFWPAERQAVAVGPKIVGVPALVDNLALVYNKKLFDQAGLAYPTADWTWDDFRAAAKKLTDPSAKQFGWAYVNDASEDTVWRFDALLWQAGGDILTADQKHAAFNSPAGVAKAATLLQQMATVDHSVYLDSGNGNYANLFNSGKIGMLFTGPWDLSAFPDVDYGIQILPGNHEPPDDLGPRPVGDARQRRCAPKRGVDVPQVVHVHGPRRCSGRSRPATCRSVRRRPRRRRTPSTRPSIRASPRSFENEQNAVKARPVLPTYNEISQAMGQAIQAILLGKAQPQQALDQAAQQVDQILAQG